MNAEQQEQLRRALAAYNAACEAWEKANAEQNDAPSVRDAERYSDALEAVAHRFAGIVDEIV